MNPFDRLDWIELRQHYDQRVATHQELVRLWQANAVQPFVKLLLGITDRAGNYSAAEHGLGPQIINSNPNGPQRVFDVAGRFLKVTSANDIPPLIRSAGLAFFKIGVGSEASCMMNPE